MDQHRQQKQKYLRQKILDKDYDAQEFMDFCQNYKGSIDIDSWTLSELKEIVQKFISTNSKTIQINPFSYNNTQSAKVQNFDWDNAFNQVVQQQQNNKSVNLNLIDLDFLESFGSKTTVKTNSLVQTKPNMSKQQTKSIITDPSALLAKLNDKNNQFISAYNTNAFNNRTKQAQVKEQYSPTLNKNSKILPQNSQNQSILIPIIKENIVIDENFKSTIKCRSFSNKPKLDSDYEVIISGHQIINPNPFVPNFVLYSITTNPLGIEVKRRLKDFQTLRTLLKKLFPATQIPFLQRYGRRLSQTQPTVIRKQKSFLQSFLNSLLMNKSIRCKIIDDFLLCQNLDSLKKIFRDFQKLDKPKGIEDLYTVNGKIEVQYSAQNKKFISQQQLYFDYMEPNMNKLKQLYDQLSVSVLNTVKIIGEITNLYDNLRDSTKNVNNLLQESLKTNGLEETFNRISEIHKQWASSMKTQAKIVQVEVRHLFRYETANLETIRDLSKTSDNLVQTYSKRNDKNEAAKQQYQFNKKLADFKVGVESPSKNTTVLKFQAGFYLQNTVNQIRRYLSELSDKLTKKFKLFSGLQLNICRDLQKNWHEFQTYANIHYK